MVFQRVASVLASRFDESMNAGHFDEAAVALANFKAAAPGDPRTGPLELRLTTAQVNKALSDGNLDKASALIRVAQQSSGISAEQIKQVADGHRPPDGRRQGPENGGPRDRPYSGWPIGGSRRGQRESVHAAIA